MIYLDTSVLGALFFREPTALAILAHLETVDKDELCISAWNLAEMASVGAIKERTRNIDTAGRAAALAAFNRFVSDSLTLAEVEPGDLRGRMVIVGYVERGRARHVFSMRKANEREAKRYRQRFAQG